MTKTDINELPNFIDKYERKIIITNYIKELANLLDEYGVDYKIVENSGVANNGFKLIHKQTKEKEYESEFRKY